MSKLLRLFFAVALLVTASYAMKPLSQKQIDELSSLELFSKAGIVIQQAYDASSLYLLKVTVQGRTDEIFLTKDKQYLIAGQVIHTTTGQTPSIPVDMKAFEGKEAFTYGTGKDEYVLFTDPQCPYCKKFESYFPQIKDKVKIKVFFYPLSFHAEAADISKFIMSQKNANEKATALFNTTKDTPAFVNRKIDATTDAKLQAQLDEQMRLAQNAGVTGTPALFNPKGQKLSWVDVLQSYNINVK